MTAPATETARGPVAAAVIAVAVALLVTSQAWGYHRDELYFRMLPPGWGSLDQPPLTPWLARTIASVVDEPWALRLPAVAAVAGTVVVVALLTREVGGGRLAQGLSAWCVAFGTFTLSFGHVLLTASLDLLLWPLVVLCAVRAVRREQPRWWLLAGAVAGVALWNKLLVVALLGALALGLLVAGPRRWLRSGWLWAGVAIAVVVGSPTLVYQVANGLPQLAMGQALGERDGGEVRWLVWPFLLLLLGPPLVPTWVAGIVALLRRPEWRDLRFLVVALAAVLVFSSAAGGQVYYPYGLLVCVYAIGCVPVAGWIGAHRGRRRLAVGAVVANALVAVVVALPVLPVDVLGNTPIPAMNQLAADQVGWGVYAAQIREVATSAEADVVLTSNYGEAGALDRYGSGGVPVVSGHTALATLTAPPPDAEVVVVVGGQLVQARTLFERCDVLATLDNGVGVDNEEQGQPVAVCRGPLLPWDELWPQLAHLD